MDEDLVQIEESGEDEPGLTAADIEELAEEPA